MLEGQCLRHGLEGIGVVELPDPAAVGPAWLQIVEETLQEVAVLVHLEGEPLEPCGVAVVAGARLVAYELAAAAVAAAWQQIVVGKPPVEVVEQEVELQEPYGLAAAVEVVLQEPCELAAVAEVEQLLVQIVGLEVEEAVVQTVVLGLEEVLVQTAVVLVEVA